MCKSISVYNKAIFDSIFFNLSCVIAFSSSRSSVHTASSPYTGGSLTRNKNIRHGDGCSCKVSKAASELNMGCRNCRPTAMSKGLARPALRASPNSIYLYLTHRGCYIFIVLRLKIGSVMHICSVFCLIRRYIAETPINPSRGRGLVHMIAARRWWRGRRGEMENGAKGWGG